MPNLSVVFDLGKPVARGYGDPDPYPSGSFSFMASTQDKRTHENGTKGKNEDQNAAG